MANHHFEGKIGESQILPEVLAAFSPGVVDPFYTVAFVGFAKNLNEFHVQVNINGNGYSSDWPEWAYLIAKDAFLYKKKLWIIANGSPFGSNLLQVLLVD